MVSSATPPPHALDLVIDFVNTLDIDAGLDGLASPSGLSEWLVQRELLADPTPLPSEANRADAVGLREALRRLLLEHNGAAHDQAAAAELERVARRGGLGVHFTPEAAVSLRPAREDLDGALACLLVPVAHAVSDGSWLRVKACRASDCAWAFYDRSRNRSGTWCDMAVCGNRTKVRAYRERAPRRGGQS